MGRSATFEIVTPLAVADALLAAIASHTLPVPEWAELCHTRRSTPELCLTLVLPFSPELAELDTGHADHPGWLSIGCIWTQCHFDAEVLRISASSATSAMAMAFEESAALQALFIHIAQTTGAQSLILIDDWHQARALWPLPDSTSGSSP